jgi:preprotein translocase subunit SecF
MKNFKLVFWLLVAATVVASIVFAAYPQVRLGTVIATIILAAILLVNRFIEPRWNLNDRQRDIESRLRMPAGITLIALVFIVMIGENGFETLSGSLQVGLISVIFVFAAYGMLFPKKLKKKD